MNQLRRELTVRRPIRGVFSFFSDAANLQRITPPWLHFKIPTPLPVTMTEGATIAYALRLHGIPIRWLTEIEEWNPPWQFVDIQRQGPYRFWRHTHRFSEADGGTRIEDQVDYALALGLLGRAVHRFQVARDLAEIFDYRASVARQIFG